ncbi:hypothetical protein F5890DRAFT_1544630 [Lentinula detonsa]|uniref:Uncharacterized protein n=1 Tax=Lentinula detonsa TaxID=2804962 RepID=A0AA38UMU9_9AGAR|nr:hypothetical protein F5890DRAFT_1544630 [Lentinula detonsa]
MHYEGMYIKTNCPAGDNSNCAPPIVEASLLVKEKFARLARIQLALLTYYSSPKNTTFIMRLAAMTVFLALFSSACAAVSPTLLNKPLPGLRPPHSQLEGSGRSRSSSRHRKLGVDSIGRTTLHVSFRQGKPWGTPGLNDAADVEARSIVEGFLMSHNDLSNDLGMTLSGKKVQFEDAYPFPTVPARTMVNFDLETTPEAPECSPKCHGTAIKVKEGTFKGRISKDLTGYPLVSGLDEPL